MHFVDTPDQIRTAPEPACHMLDQTLTKAHHRHTRVRKIYVLWRHSDITYTYTLYLIKIRLGLVENGHVKWLNCIKMAFGWHVMVSRSYSLMEVYFSLKESLCFLVEKEFRSLSKATQHKTSATSDFDAFCNPVMFWCDLIFLWLIS